MGKARLDITKVDQVALGAFGVRNESSFWVALVEGKKLPHLGYTRDDVSGLRNSLALGEILFHDGPGGIEQFEFIDNKTREFLTSGRLRRIYFDITNMDVLSGKIGGARFAFIELKLIMNTDALFRITSFYKEGRYIRMPLEARRNFISKLLENRV